MFSRKNLDAYRKNSLRAELSVADPYTITKMLYQGAFERLAQAKGAIEHGDMEANSAPLEAAIRVLLPIKDAWDSIPLSEQEKAAAQRRSEEASCSAPAMVNSLTSGQV